MNLLIQFALWSLVAWTVLKWEKYPASFRNWIPRLLLVAALIAFGVAPFLKGEYSQDVILFIGGPYAYPIETIERSFSGLAMGIGFGFLFLYALASWGHRLPGKGPLAKAVSLTLVVLLFRVYVEKLGVPQGLALSVGIIWLIVPLAVYFGWEAARAGTQRKFWAWLLGYAFGIRVLVVAVMPLTTHFGLGTHFDNSSVTHFTVFDVAYQVEAHSWEQYRSLIIGPQMLLWPAVTIFPGLLLGWPTYWVASRRRRRLAG